MRPTTRLLLRDSVQASLAFLLANYAFYWVSYVGNRALYGPGPLQDYLAGPAIHVEMAFTAVGMGVLVVAVDRWTDRPRGRSLPALGLVALRTAIFLAVFLALEGLVFTALPAMGVSPSARRAGVAQMTPGYLVMVTAVPVAVAFAITFTLQLRRLVGPGVLWALLVGRYRRPRTESQVFLFMDLQDSTTLAERMGHRRYSAFLQACFRDLTDVALQNGARVYQYVGDEVVLHWPATDTGAARSAIRTYFQYDRTLSGGAEGYHQRFGAAPVFRGGAGAGSVTVAEIGEIKRSIAFHGDPVNTASRILDLCKANGGRLFVQADLWDPAAHAPEVRVVWEGEVRLKGKGQDVQVLGLDRVPEP